MLCLIKEYMLYFVFYISLISLVSCQVQPRFECFLEIWAVVLWDMDSLGADVSILFTVQVCGLRVCISDYNGLFKNGVITSKSMAFRIIWKNVKLMFLDFPPSLSNHFTGYSYSVHRISEPIGVICHADDEVIQFDSTQQNWNFSHLRGISRI